MCKISDGYQGRVGITMFTLRSVEIAKPRRTIIFVHIHKPEDEIRLQADRAATGLLKTRLGGCPRRAARLTADCEILAHDQTASPGDRDGGVSNWSDVWR